KFQQQFRLGRESTSDLPRSGRPSEVDVGSISARISEIIQSDRRVSVRRIADDVGESIGTVWKIIHEELRMNKLATRWVPRILTTPQKADRVTICRENLDTLRAGREDFLDSIVTGDESWVYYYDPLSSQEAREWTEAGQHPSGHSRSARSAG